MSVFVKPPSAILFKVGAGLGFVKELLFARVIIVPDMSSVYPSGAFVELNFFVVGVYTQLIVLGFGSLAALNFRVAYSGVDA